ncbi:MAG: roadblock/LC7 domain-containing protein [Candidatus Ranarchaeia archaeon]
MSSPYLNQIREIFRKMISGESGIKHILLADRTGVTLLSQSRNPWESIMDGMGAIISAVFVASEQQGMSLASGKLGMVTSEFDKHKVFSMSVGDAILSIITARNVQMGLIRLLLNKYGKAIEELLKQRLVAEGKDTELESALSELGS